MEKVVKIALPKGKETTDVKVRVSEEELIVTYNLEEKFSPKDGDFLFDKEYKRVFIHSGRTSMDITGDIRLGSYIGENAHKFIIKADLSPRIIWGWVKAKNCRYATEQEKADFLERPKKECNLVWNKKTKKLETIRWRANRTEVYHYVSISPEIRVATLHDIRCTFDDSLYDSGNYFRTPEAAKKVADQIKEILKNSKAE